MLGIELLFNMSLNNKLFTKGMRESESDLTKFYASYQENLNRVSANFSFAKEATESFKKLSNSMIPITVNWSKLSKGDEFVMSRTLDNAANSVSKVENMFKKFLDMDMTPKGLQNLNTILMDMGKRNYDNITESFSKFNTNLDKFTPKQQKLYIDLLDKLKDEKSVEGAKDISKQMKAITDLPMGEFKENLLDSLKGLQSFLKTALGLGSLYAIFTDIMDVQTELSRNIWQMGKTSKGAYQTMIDKSGEAVLNVEKLKKSIRDEAASYMAINRRVATTTQASLSEVGQTMAELMKMRVGTNTKADFESLTETSVLMQKALGMSSSSANEFVHSLSVIGGVGAKDIRTAAQEISNVQQNLGLSESEATLVGVTVGKLVRQFKAFGGGGSKDVQVVTKEVAKMTAAFTSVGLAAEDASSIVMDMMNPDNLQKSVLLWSNMGMSAAEGFAMMQGEGKNMVGMTEKMVKVAKNLKTQYGGNIFALRAMAEANGLNLEQVQALSQYDASRLKDMKKTAKLEEAAAAARQGISDQIKRLKDQLMVILQSTLLPILKILGNILEPIINAVAWVNKAADSGNVVGKILRFAIIGGLMTIMGILPKMFGLTKNIVNQFIKAPGKITEIKDKFTGLITGAKKFGETFAESWKSGKEAGESVLTRMKKGITSLFKKKESPIDAVSKAKEGIDKGSVQAGKGAKGLEETGKALKKFPDPKTLLAIGAAMLMIAAGISIVILSITQLVKAVGEANLSFGQLAGIAIMLVPVFAGFIGLLLALTAIIPALGAAGTAGAVGILAIGAAMLMMGAGIALIVLSITKLVQSFATLGENASIVSQGIVSIIKAVSLLVATSALLVASIAGMALAMSGASAGVLVFVGAIALLAISIPILMLLNKAITTTGESFLNMGNGVMLMANNFNAAIDGLLRFKQELGGKWKGVADQVVSEIERINEKLNEMKTLTSGVLATTIITQVVGKMSGENEAARGVEAVDYTSHLNTINSYLGTIANNTGETNSLLKDLIKETKKNVKIRTQVSLTANAGA